MYHWGTSVAQWIKRPTLDFGSGHDLTVRGFEPCVRLCPDNAEPAWDSLSPSLSAPHLLVLSLSLSLSFSHSLLQSSTTRTLKVQRSHPVQLSLSTTQEINYFSNFYHYRQLSRVRTFWQCIFFLMFTYFWERQSVSGAEAEREGDTESQASSRLRAVSTEPDARLKPTNRKIMTWVEVGHSTDWATQGALWRCIFKHL